MSKQQVDPRVEALRIAATTVSLSAGADIWVEILAALDEADRAAGIVRVRLAGVQSAPQYDSQGSFVGFAPQLYEHRPTGPDSRAWSFEASEWCYPSRPCAVCSVGYKPLEESGD